MVRKVMRVRCDRKTKEGIFGQETIGEDVIRKLQGEYVVRKTRGGDVIKETTGGRRGQENYCEKMWSAILLGEDVIRKTMGGLCGHKKLQMKDVVSKITEGKWGQEKNRGKILSRKL